MCYFSLSIFSHTFFSEWEYFCHLWESGPQLGERTARITTLRLTRPLRKAELFFFFFLQRSPFSVKIQTRLIKAEAMASNRFIVAPSSWSGLAVPQSCFERLWRKPTGRRFHWNIHWVVQNDFCWKVSKADEPEFTIEIWAIRPLQNKTVQVLVIDTGYTG